jgi:magnesium-transporting ATPase (P-type)
MITGDKAETAVAIGRMCGLLKPEHELELLLKLSGTALSLRLDELQNDASKTFVDTNSRTTLSTTLTQVLRKTFSTIPDLNDVRTSENRPESMMEKSYASSKKEKNGESGSSPSSQFLPSNIDDDARSNVTSQRSGAVLEVSDLSNKL